MDNIAYERKTTILKSYNEAEFRKRVATLLRYMGYHGVKELHGTLERGKDIIGYKTNELGNEESLACVVKIGDIKGDVTKASSAQNVFNQIQQVFDAKYFDSSKGKEISIDRAWVITTGKINPHAEEGIKGALQKYNLDKFVKFIEGGKFIELVDGNENMQNFWNEQLPRAIIDAVNMFQEGLTQEFNANPEFINQIPNIAFTITSGTSTAASMPVVSSEIRFLSAYFGSGGEKNG